MESPFYSCTWNKDEKVEKNSRVKWLDVTHGGVTKSILFGAFYYPDAESLSLQVM